LKAEAGAVALAEKAAAEKAAMEKETADKAAAEKAAMEKKAAAQAEADAATARAAAEAEAAAKLAAEEAAKRAEAEAVAAKEAEARAAAEAAKAAADAALLAAESQTEEKAAKAAADKAAAARAATEKELASDMAVSAIDKFIAAQKVNTENPRWRLNLKKPPLATFDPKKSYFWNLETNKGRIKVRFLPEVAPMHVGSTIYLTRLGFYDGLSFHRVIPGFMAQGGCPMGSGTGGPGYEYPGEFDPKVRHDRGGLLSMANRGPGPNNQGTDGSQFFLTFAETRWLDDKHTIFGEVVEGTETLGKLEAAGSPQGPTSEKLVMEKCSISVEAKPAR
jgi:cyclophilin family peptidyl-prolyl cis-trans isomerase